jgi:hypothetical protein
MTRIPDEQTGPPAAAARAGGVNRGESNHGRENEGQTTR